MFKYVKFAASAAIVAGGLTMGSLGASAMPAVDMHANATTSPIERTYLVCGPYGCWHRPGYYGYYGWRRPWGWGGYGWHRGWGGGWRGGWHGGGWRR